MLNSSHFVFKNKEIEYATKYIKHYLQKTERLVELPLAKLFLETYGHREDLIEIGCVTPYYFDVYHNIYDLQDKHPKNQKLNAKFVDTKNKYVLSISTIEHFNISGYNISSDNFLDPAEWLTKTISNSLGFFITFPMGFNSILDDFILKSSITTSFLSRSGNSNTWIQKNKSELSPKDIMYDFSYTTCANTIAVIENTL